MNINTKIETKKEATKSRAKIVSINDIAGFWDNPRYENCWIYNGRMPKANCWIFINENFVEIHNVMVYDSDARGTGIGTAMIADIRRAFPSHSIWVDSWNCTKGFWQKMIEIGKIDFIANDYSWPCTNTTCTVCHKDRPTHARRSVFE